MSLSVSVRAGLGDFRLDATFESSGRLTALFGPSGSGKSSVVNMVAGLLKPDEGRIVADGVTFIDTSRRIVMPPHRRRIGYVFQDSRLLPHLTVSQNLRYGRFFAPAGDRYADLAQIVELLGIGRLLERRPHKLSGGERQRVAIGRALLASPRLMLLDEPLAALDDARKAEILPYIERLRDETRVPILYVSHSVAEVARLATDVVIMDGGTVAASGTAEDVLSRLDILPESERGEGGALIDLTPHGPPDGFGLAVYRSRAGEWRLPRKGMASPHPVRVRVRARDVMLATRKPEDLSALNVLPGRISAMTGSDHGEVLVTLDCNGDRLLARLTASSVARLQLAVGSEVYAVIKAVSLEAGGASGVPPRSN